MRGCRKVVEMDLSIPTETFLWLETDDQRQCWLEMNQLHKRRSEASLRVIVGSDIKRWAFTVASDCTVLQLKRLLCSRMDVADFREDQITLLTDENGFLEDTCVVGDVCTDLGFIGALVAVSGTVCLHSSAMELLEEYRLKYDPDARFSDVNVHVLTDGVLCLVPRTSQR